MVLHAVTQIASNGWRAFLWRNYVDWRIIGGYAIGSFAVFLAMKLVAVLPAKAVVYIGMGITPFIVLMLPMRFVPEITRKGAPILCGAAVMFVQLLAGVAGNVLDVFFQRSQLDRKTVVATKAASQVLAHLQRAPSSAPSRPAATSSRSGSMPGRSPSPCWAPRSRRWSCTASPTTIFAAGAGPSSCWSAWSISARA